MWTIPTGFAVFRAVGLGWLLQLESLNPDSPWNFALWTILNCGFALGVGWCGAKLSLHAQNESYGFLYRVVKFFCLQLAIIPIFGYLLIILTYFSGLIPI
jgi:hypothetical protein